MYMCQGMTWGAGRHALVVGALSFSIFLHVEKELLFVCFICIHIYMQAYILVMYAHASIHAYTRTDMYIFYGGEITCVSTLGYVNDLSFGKLHL